MRCGGLSGSVPVLTARCGGACSAAWRGGDFDRRVGWEGLTPMGYLVFGDGEVVGRRGISPLGFSRWGALLRYGGWGRIEPEYRGLLVLIRCETESFHGF